MFRKQLNLFFLNYFYNNQSQETNIGKTFLSNTHSKKMILFGSPGAGKGSFATRIKEVVNIVHISTGDIFRENIKNQTLLGVKAKKYIERGALVPDDIVIDMVKQRLKKRDVMRHGFILDGFPRTLNQALELSKITSIDLFLLFEIPKNFLLKRILGRYCCQTCGKLYNEFTNPPKRKGFCDNCNSRIEIVQRSDDTEEAAKRRIDEYEEYAQPIINYYRQYDGIVKTINGEIINSLSHDQIKEIIRVKK
jgi:adenylate kinase